MRVKPFSCVRPTPEHLDEALASAPETREDLDTAKAQGRYAIDAARALYLVELRDQAERSVTGVVCCCPVEALDDGTLTCSSSLRPADETLFRAQVGVAATRMGQLGAQDEPVTLVHPASFALDVIVCAAKTGTALCATERDGVRLTVWRVGRAEAVEALEATFEALPGAQVRDQASHLAAEAVEECARRQRATRPVSTGREPYERFVAFLVPESQLWGPAPTLPRGLFMHLVA